MASTLPLQQCSYLATVELLTFHKMCPGGAKSPRDSRGSHLLACLNKGLRFTPCVPVAGMLESHPRPSIIQGRPIRNNCRRLRGFMKPPSCSQLLVPSTIMPLCTHHPRQLAEWPRRRIVSRGTAIATSRRCRLALNLHRKKLTQNQTELVFTVNPTVFYGEPNVVGFAPCARSADTCLPCVK